MQSKLPMHQSKRCRARTRRGSQVPVSRDEERALPDARWTVDGRTEGES